jgi:DnaJ-domain-containing protein 1
MKEKSKKLFLEFYQMLLSDAEVHPKELEVLYQFGKKCGVSEEEIQQMLFSPNNFISPKDLSVDEKIEHLYNLAQIAWADGKIEKEEEGTLQNASKRLGFAEENVKEIATFLLDQVHSNKPFEEVLEIIKNS